MRASTMATSSAFSHGCLRWNGRVAPANHAARKLACQVQQITNEDIAKNAWVSPGWRGAYVSSQPESTQTALVAGVTLLGALLTYFTYTTAGPWVCNNVPLMDTYMTKAPFIQGPLIAAAGVAHFYPLHEEFCSFYPHRGAWGFWYASSFPDIQPYIARTAQAVRAALGVFALASGAAVCRYLPGSPSFHVWWTGVAEFLGGVGMVLGALDLPFTPDWLLPASSFGLFLLVAAVSPSNMYMWTHNAPGPIAEEDLEKLPDGVVPLQFHVIRGALQVVLLSTFLGLAFHNY